MAAIAGTGTGSGRLCVFIAQVGGTETLFDRGGGSEEVRVTITTTQRFKICRSMTFLGTVTVHSFIAPWKFPEVGAVPLSYLKGLIFEGLYSTEGFQSIASFLRTIQGTSRGHSSAARAGALENMIYFYHHF